MSSTPRDVGSSLDFFGLLTILFIGLKLTGFIDWSWWVVLSPLWGSVLAVLTIALAFLTLAYLIKD